MSAQSRYCSQASLLAVLTLSLAGTTLRGQSDSSGSAPVYHYEPWPLACGQSVLTAGVVFALAPEPIVENEVPVPSLDVQYRRGLIPDVSLVATITTNVVASLGQLGMQWNDTAASLSYAAGANAVGFLGWLSDEGMFANSWAFAYGAVPFARVGYRFEEFSVSAMLAASWIVDAESRTNGMRTPANLSSPLNDYYMTLAIEQPFLRTGRVSTGLSFTLSRTPYQSWILFDTFDQYLLISEFFVGFQL